MVRVTRIDFVNIAINEVIGSLTVICLNLSPNLLQVFRLKGEAALAVRPALPIEGVAVILGKKLAGDRVWSDISPSVAVEQKLSLDQDLDESKRDFPEVFTACAVTRAMSRIKTVADPATPSSTDIPLEKFSLHLSVSLSELVLEQQTDSSLSELFQLVKPDTEIEDSASGYFLQNLLLAFIQRCQRNPERYPVAQSAICFSLATPRGNRRTAANKKVLIFLKCSPKPVVIIEPDTQVFRGERVTFRCDIQRGGDTEWTHSWNKNDHTLYSDRTTQEFDSVRNDASVKYTCRGRRSDSQRTKDKRSSDTFIISSTEKPKPTVSVNPQSSVYTGDRVTLSCNLQSTGWKFFWYKNDQKSNPLSPEATDTNTLSVTVSNEGQINYYCKARRGNYDSEFSDPATITVRVRPKPVVKVQAAEPVFIGETVIFSCEIQTGGSWQYHWYRDNKEVKDTAGNNQYTISDVKASDKGDYTCKGTKSSDPKYTQTSDAVTLTVSEKPKPELTSVLKGAALTGNSVTLSCTLQLQSAGWKFYWNKDTQSTETETETHSYTISSVRVSDGGQYKCRAGRGNPVYYTHYSDALWVKVTESPKPVVIIEPDTQVFRGERVTFRCDIQRGGDTEWTYSWNKNDYTLYSDRTTQEFSISSVRDSDGGKYTCRGRRSDSQSSEISDPVTLSVSEKPKPELTSDRKGDVLTGNSVTLNCTLQLQSAGWKFYWIKPTQSTETETETHSYTIRSFTVSDGGQYKCRAGRGNPVYYTHYSDALWVNIIESPKPVVSIKPDTQVFRGETVTFRCDIQEGRGTEWTYDWYRDDSTFYPSHTTQEFSISVENYHGGKYTCRGRRSDSQISKTSDPVTLSVSEKPKPELTSDLKGAALTGNSVTLNCTLKLQSAGWKFYWNKDTQRRQTETETHSYTISSVRVSDGGQYKCRAGRGNPVYYTHYSDALWVNVIESPKPVVSIKPDTQVFRGERVTFRCDIQEGRGTEWTYDWYRDNSTFYPSHTTQEFIISVRNYHGGKYTCRGRRSDSQISEMSDPVTLSVSGGSPPVSLIISPSRTQHFTADSLSLSCEDQSDSTGWTVRGYTHNETLFDCSSVSGSTCNISSLSTSHTGVYWCQSESGGRSNSVIITVHNGDLILESPVHPVTEGNPLTLRCLNRSKISDSGADFYKNDSILQSQTTGEMTISSVSESDEGFYHCKHPERGESPKSWVSVRVSASGSTGVIIGLSSAFVFVILMILLIPLLHYKKKRGVEHQTPSAVNQDTNQPADGDNIYENTNMRTTDDSAAEASNMLYSEVVTRKKKQKDDSAAEASNMLYSEVVTRKKKQKDAAAGPSDVTYADIELKNQKKPKRKQGKSSEAADTVYSELKQNTDKGP
ncbi:Fc receptor-like protein 5 [Pangasianodon hypophthalmus]|uniref:Fc receptor-like protein 5 n=1 Tax=Pangasianodon hypophthalmus TaxID=310915 RepID=UPI0023070C9A|nr:Fc receptor-like protein 5 [Pangasianodon hypophthalmus]